MSGFWKWTFGILIGAAAVIGVTALAVAIGCAVNGIGFTDQIVQWVGGGKYILAPVENGTVTNSVMSLFHI